MSTANSNVAAIRQNVQGSYGELIVLLNGPLQAIAPAKLYEIPVENEWTIMEILAHIVEIMPYWADEVARLVELPGQNFGRTMENPERIAAVRDHSHDSLAQIAAALPGSYARLNEVLASLKDSDLLLTGVHPRRGTKTLDWFIEEFITKHLSDHIIQIKECLQSIS